MTHGLLKIQRVGPLHVQPHRWFEPSLETVETLIVADTRNSSFQIHKSSCVVFHASFLDEPRQLVPRLLSVICHAKLPFSDIEEFLPCFYHSFAVCLYQVLPP